MIYTSFSSIQCTIKQKAIVRHSAAQQASQSIICCIMSTFVSSVRPHSQAQLLNPLSPDSLADSIIWKTGKPQRWCIINLLYLPALFLSPASRFVQLTTFNVICCDLCILCPSRLPNVFPASGIASPHMEAWGQHNPDFNYL